MDVESVADELYGLPLAEFITTRAEREKQAKSAGDKELAAQIRRLAKPRPVAWLANQLARECADEIGSLLELGEALREATAARSGEQLRELSRRQQGIVHSLVQRAGRLAGASGRKVSGDAARGLEDTLRAALVDPDAADHLVTGRLTEGMQNSGFGSTGFWEANPAPAARKPTLVAVPLAADGPSPASHRQTSDPRRRAAEDEIEQAEFDAEVAITSHLEASAQLEAAAQAVADSGDRVERVRRELDEALQEQSSARRTQRRAQTALDRAEGSARDAQKRLAKATDRLNRLPR